MIKKILLFLSLMIWIQVSVFADFSSSDLMNGAWTFVKPAWVNDLYVHEEYIINPFKNSTIIKNTIVCTGNNCPCGPSGCSYVSGYTVDGRVFNASHPLYKRFWAIRKNWWQESDGVSTRIEYRGNTYTTEAGVLKPDQSVRVRKYYAVRFKHDVSTPSCWEVRYFNDQALTQSFTYNWGWLNKPKYYTMICEDAQTGCYCDPDDSNCQVVGNTVISTPQLLWHNIRPSVSFTNRVNLTDTSCQPGWTFRKVLYDLKNPKVDITLWSEDLQLNLETNRLYDVVSGKKLDWIETTGRLSFTRNPWLHFKAWVQDLDISIEDVYLSWSVHGVSGIKDYTFTIERLTDRWHNTLSTKQDISSCSRNASFPEYNSNWNITSSDLKNISLSCTELLQSWKYHFLIDVTDWSGNRTNIVVPVNIYPNDVNFSNSSITTWDFSNKYANNSDTYLYEVTLQDTYNNPLFNRTIDSIRHNISWFSWWKDILTDSNDSALIVVNPQSTTDNDGKITYELKSLKPWNFTQRFTLSYRDWWRSYIQNGANRNFHPLIITDNTFVKPFTAALSVVSPGTSPEVGTLQRYKIDLNNIGWISSISNGNVNISQSTITFASWHLFDTFQGIDNSFTLSNPVCHFSGSINSSSASSVLQAPIVETNNLLASYIIGWKRVTYPLDNVSVTGCSKDTLGLKVIGNIQWEWKWNITGQKDNFSDISQTTLRTQIQKNALRVTAWMNSWDTINNIHFVEWDITISWNNLAYETLIVKNGNVFIDADLNTSEEKLWIIVLKDGWYNLKSDYNNLWNVYIWKDVENISAMIYADGTLTSARSNGSIYTDWELSKKLYLKGWVFTRNTIWGAVSAGSEYLLPGWERTSDIDLAKVYDFNYVRKTQICWDEYSFLIEYNASIQQNPPKWFEN